MKQGAIKFRLLAREMNCFTWRKGIKLFFIGSS